MSRYWLPLISSVLLLTGCASQPKDEDVPDAYMLTAIRDDTGMVVEVTFTNWTLGDEVTLKPNFISVTPLRSGSYYISTVKGVFAGKSFEQTLARPSSILALETKRINYTGDVTLTRTGDALNPVAIERIYTDTTVQAIEAKYAPLINVLGIVVIRPGEQPSVIR